MKNAKVSGKHLKMLTQNITYLQRFGIIEFDEELALQGHIQNLIDGKIKNQLFKGLERDKKKEITSNTIYSQINILNL